MRRATVAVPVLAVIGALAGCGGSDPEQSPTRDLPEPPAVATVVPDGPVIRPAGGESYVNPGGVVADAGRWWALANSFTRYPGASRTDLLVSPDLLSWKLAGPRVLDEQAVTTRTSYFTMSLVPDGERGWVAFGYDFAGPDRPGSIHRATAQDLEGPWTVDPRPVLGPGDAGRWSATRLAEPEVLRTGDGGWVMWFTGIGPEGAAIGRATSEDGVTWAADHDPVLTGVQGWTAGEVDGPQVVQTDDGYLMAYSSAPRGRYEVGLAFSGDGREWEPWAGNPVLDQSDLPEDAGLFQAALVRDGEDVVLLQESGPGPSNTVVHAVRIDVDAAHDARLPVVEAGAEVDGDRVVVRVEVPGVALGFDPSADPDALHPHLYVDVPPPPAGSTVPRDAPAVVHASGDRVEVEDLAPGEHDLWVVLADGREEVARLPVPVRVRVVVS